MTDPSGRYVLSYNGELYNFHELRESLHHFWDFRTSGDTEVLLAGLVLHGESFLERMEGMWAFAFWDKRDENLFIARDRIGKKPLFYYHEKQLFSCASELSALACLSPIHFTEDLDSTADYLRYGYYLPGTTAYQNVHEVLPGHILKWSPDQGVRQKPYWSLPIGGFNGSKLQARKIFRDTFIQSVKRRLVADVEVGAFLSGGIDSSLIVAVLVKELGVQPKTFTIGFSDASFDETNYADLMAETCKTHHIVKRLEKMDKEELLALILDHSGQPFSDSSLLPTAMISQLASEYVKVVLSGDGGDELFSGYQRYQARVLMRWYSRLPRIVRKNIGGLINLFPEPMSHHSRSFLKKAHLFLDLLEQEQANTPYIAPLLYSPKDFQVLAPELVGKGHAPPGLPTETEAGSFFNMMATDALIYLPQDIMAKVDRASMAYSLETRAPFLDRRVIEHAFSLPPHWHRRGFSGKRILKEAFSDLLPAKIVKRRKQGFSVPIHRWFKEDLAYHLDALAREKESPLNLSTIHSMLKAHVEGRRDHAHRLWNIYIYFVWRNNLGNPDSVFRMQ